MDSKQPEILTTDIVREVGNATGIEEIVLRNLIQVAEWNNQDIWYMVVNRKLAIVRVGKSALQMHGAQIIRSSLYGVLEPW